MDAIFLFGCPVNKTRLASFADSLPAKSLLLFLVLQLVFVLCNTAANCLPRAVVETHAQDSESSALLTDMYVYDHRVFAGPVCFDNNRFILESAQQKDQGSPLNTMAVAEIDDVAKSGGITHQRYYRYWHGWQLLTNICLFIGGIDVVVVPAAALAIAGSACAYLALRKRFSVPLTLGFLVILLFSTNLFFNVIGDLLLCISFFMALIMMSCMSLRLDSASNARTFTSRLILWSIATGAMFSFLDFLTIPAAVVALHCFFVFIALPEDERPKRCVIMMLQALFGFGLSFVLTWAMKWVVAAFVLGWNEIFSNVLGEMGLWSAHGSSSLLPQADWPQILKDFYCMSPQLFAICSTAGYAMLSNVVCLISFVVVLAIWVGALVCSVRGGAQDARRRKALTQSLLMVLPLVVVLGYFVVMHDHAIVHIPVFGCKNWAIVFAMLFASGACALRGLRGRKNA